MNENEKIAYAMEHYTEGCVYTHPDYNYRKEYTFKYKPNSYEVFSNSTGNVNAGQGNGYLYFNNQWATVIKKGIEPDWVAIAKIKYPEGTTYICPFSLKTYKMIVKDETYELMGGSSINAGELLGYLRYNEVWATIVEDEKVDSVNDPLVKFEVGKWYKYNSGYKKFSKLENNRFYYSEDIYRSNYKYYKNLNWCCESLGIILLTDLTEIQEYLPDGHVDKINKETNMFKKGDYIVLLAGKTNKDWQLNYCYKQRIDYCFLSVEKDCNQGRNDWGILTFDKNNDWRYATKEEIAEYNRIDKPFDVTTLVKKSENWYINETLTEEQFDKLINHLRNKGYVYYNHCNFGISYTTYKEREFIRVITDYEIKYDSTKPNHPKAFCIDNNSNGNSTKRLYSSIIDSQSVPTYVECIESYSGSYEIGKIYKVDEIGDVISYGKPTAKWNNTNDYQSKFKPSTTDDWNAQEINKSNIDEFTKKYPIKNTMTDDIGEIIRKEEGKYNTPFWVMYDPNRCSELKHSPYGKEWVYDDPITSFEIFNSIKNPYNTNLIKVLYTKSKQKTKSKEKIKKVKFLNVNIIKIN